jgi:hypothetical protein
LVDQVKISVIATGFDETKKRLRELSNRPARYAQPTVADAPFRGTPTPPPQTVAQPQQPTPPAQGADELPPEEDEFDIPAFLRQRS